MDASAGGERVLCGCRVQLAIVPHPEGPDGRGVSARGHGEAAPGACAFRVGCARWPAGLGPRHPRGAGASARRDDFRDTERLAAAAADDGRLRQHGRDDAYVAAAVADRLHAHPAAGRAVPRGRTAEAAGAVARRRRGVGLEGTLEPLRRRTVPALRLGVSVTSEKPLLGCGSSGWSRPSSSAMARNLRLWYRPARDVSRTPRAAAMPWTASCSSRSKESSCPHADDDSRSGTRARQDRAVRGGTAECRPTPVPALRREQVVSVSCSRNDNEPGCLCVPIPGHPK